MTVAPFTGAWIEIKRRPLFGSSANVAPFTGAWIEIPRLDGRWARGTVAPFTGAWIEIPAKAATPSSRARRSLHGSVD